MTDEIKIVKEQVQAEIERLAPDLLSISQFLHANPEIAYEERQAAELLTDVLGQHGFAVERGLANLPTSFKGTIGSGAPRIAFLAEYDALPGLGHACGHNLIGTASLGAALAVGSVLGRVPGTAVLVGCPAEEKGGGKIALVTTGVFDDIDAALMVHPSNRTELIKFALGMREVTVEFFGKATHAAMSPDLGINALDAAVLAYTSIGVLRQQLRPDARIHGIITHGGQAPNIIPEYAAARFFVRSLDIHYVDTLFGRVVACCEGAAKATGCTVKFTSASHTYHPHKPAYAFAEIFQKNWEALGETVDQGPMEREIGSTDVGNVSQVVPTIQPMVQICGPDISCHMTGFAEASASEVGHRVMLTSAKALAMTAVDLLADPAALAKVTTEFRSPATR